LLAATVSNARGLGSYGANDLAPEDIVKVAAEIRQLTDKPLGDFYAASCFSLVRIAVRAALFSWSFCGITGPCQSKNGSESFSEQENLWSL